MTQATETEKVSRQHKHNLRFSQQDSAGCSVQDNQIPTDKMMNDDNDAYCCSFADVQAAAMRIQNIAHRTPILTSQSINDIMMTGAETEATSMPNNSITATKVRPCRIFFKVEALQKTGSFKFRGALNAVRSILEQQQQQQSLTVVTHSSGNHAQALALAAKLSSCCSSDTVQATIVMPESAPRVKTQAVIDFGGIPVMVANNNEAREEACERIRQETGAIFVHPSEDPRVIAGQGTVCLELVQQVREQYKVHSLDVVIIPVGGGGLAAGNTIALRALHGRGVKIVLAEPAEMDDAYRSFQAQQLLLHHPDNPLHSVADGLKTTLGPNTWPIVRDGVDDVFTVSEAQILKATKIVWERLKIMIEPSAGVGVAVALFHPEFRQKYCSIDKGNDHDDDSNDSNDTNTNIGIVLCGGNVDVVKIAALMHEMGL